MYVIRYIKEMCLSKYEERFQLYPILRDEMYVIRHIKEMCPSKYKKRFQQYPILRDEMYVTGYLRRNVQLKRVRYRWNIMSEPEPRFTTCLGYKPLNPLHQDRSIYRSQYLGANGITAIKTMIAVTAATRRLPYVDRQKQPMQQQHYCTLMNVRLLLNASLEDTVRNLAKCSLEAQIPFAFKKATTDPVYGIQGISATIDGRDITIMAYRVTDQCTECYLVCGNAAPDNAHHQLYRSLLSRLESLNLIVRTETNCESPYDSIDQFHIAVQDVINTVITVVPNNQARRPYGPHAEKMPLYTNSVRAWMNSKDKSLKTFAILNGVSVDAIRDNLRNIYKVLTAQEQEQFKDFISDKPAYRKRLYQ